jgi:uncharacterized damage-inducible protein DinB
MSDPKIPEPWLRGTLMDVPPVGRAVLHALELAREDLWKWCGSLADEELSARPGGIAPVAFHLRHIARSADRLLTYAEDKSLDDKQMADLKTELAPLAKSADLFAELNASLDQAAQRIRRLAAADLQELRVVGQKRLPTTLAGLLVHVAEHTQRHVGQAITTAKIVLAQRGQTA